MSTRNCTTFAFHFNFFSLLIIYELPGIVFPTTYYNFQALLCLHHATADYHNSPFLSTTIILLLNRLPASSSSNQTTDRLGRCFRRGFCAIKPTVNISNISQKTSQTSVSVFCTSLHITHRHTLKHVENIPGLSKHALHNFPRYLTEHLLLC